MLPLIAMLATQGLNLVGNAALVKGKEWIKEKTGVDLGKADLSQDDYLKLKQFELEHEEELLRLQHEDNKLDKELEIAYLADTQSARTMQIGALAQSDLFAKRFIYYFAIGWTLLAAAFIGAITFTTIPPDNVRFADTILGFLLGTVVSQMIQFFYGSSQSSQAKDETIKIAMEAP